MVVSPAAEDALAWAMRAADAMEEAARLFGPLSEDSRLAKKAHEHFMEDYHALLNEKPQGTFWERRCAECPCCPGCKDYDV